ncbi:MAG: GNAT family N-acetyltransferase [Anaerolineales bacterium]|nr:GNAT family N-acetyltransferase [Anaerolineales bacterium]
MPLISTRTSRPTDEQEIIEICHLTGDLKIDPYLLALRWCLDYLWHEPENCFVAERCDLEKVVGYIVGTLDTRQQEQRLLSIMLPKARDHWRKLSPKTFSQWRGYLNMRGSFRNTVGSLITEYPAHLHINVHPDFQRTGIGSRLFEAYENNLIQNSVKGYHLGVAGNNQTGISFYEKQGLSKLSQYPRFGKPSVIYYGRKLD